MSKSAEEVKEDLARRKREKPDKIGAVHENGQSNVPSSCRLEHVPVERRLRRSRAATTLESDGHNVPPHSVDAEKGILCAILNRPAAVLPIAQQSVGPDHFYLPQHRSLFENVCTYFNDEGVFDMVMLLQHLIDMGRIDSVGGPGYLNEIFIFGAIPENASYYIDILNEKYAFRSIIKDGTEAVRRAYEDQSDLPSLVEFVEGWAGRIATLTTPRKSGLTVRTPGELMNMTFDESDNYFGDRILAAGQPCTLIGPGGIGKSRFSLQMAVSMITGRDFIDMPTRAKGRKWLFVQTENSNRRLHHDLKNIVSALALTCEELAAVERCLLIHTLENEADFFLTLLYPENYGAIHRLIQKANPDFVEWDPLNSFTDNDLNSDMDMRALVSAIAAVTHAGNPNRLPFVLHHSLTGKVGAARAVGWDRASYGRNSKVLQAWTRAQINLAQRSGDEPNLLLMSCGKNNNGKFFPEVGLLFDEDLGIYVKDESFDPQEFREAVGLESSKKKKPVEPEQVAQEVEDGIPGPVLVRRLMRRFEISQATAYRALDKAIAAGLVREQKGKNFKQIYFKQAPKPQAV